MTHWHACSNTYLSYVECPAPHTHTTSGGIAGVYLDEESRLDELNSQIEKFQNTIQKQREEIRDLEKELHSKNTDLELVCFVFCSFSMCRSLVLHVV